MGNVRHVFAIDSHGAGMSSRIVLGPLIWKKCSNMSEKMAFFEEKYDGLRRALILEPKGHDNMFGSVICEPCDPEADIGAFFIHTGGTLNMCGHGTIALVTSLIELGIVDTHGETEQEVRIDTPAGLVETTAYIDGSKVTGVSFRNVPSFLYRKDCIIDIPGFNNVVFDLSFGGSFFAAVPFEQFGIDLDISNAKLLVDIAMSLKKSINKQFKVQHPIKPINTVDLISLYHFDQAKHLLKSCVVFGLGQIDRSPCGTSTSAITALFYNKGLIGLHDEFISESMLGTRFCAEAVEELDFEGYKAIVPKITGTGYVLGTQQFFIDERDPLKEGFTLQAY